MKWLFSKLKAVIFCLSLSLNALSVQVSSTNEACTVVFNNLPRALSEQNDPILTFLSKNQQHVLKKWLEKLKKRRKIRSLAQRFRDNSPMISWASEGSGSAIETFQGYRPWVDNTPLKKMLGRFTRLVEDLNNSGSHPFVAATEIRGNKNIEAFIQQLEEQIQTETGREITDVVLRPGRKLSRWIWRPIQTLARVWSGEVELKPEFHFRTRLGQLKALMMEKGSRKDEVLFYWGAQSTQGTLVDLVVRNDRETPVLLIAVRGQKPEMAVVDSSPPNSVDSRVSPPKTSIFVPTGENDLFTALDTSKWKWSALTEQNGIQVRTVEGIPNILNIQDQFLYDTDTGYIFLPTNQGDTAFWSVKYKRFNGNKFWKWEAEKWIATNETEALVFKHFIDQLGQ